MTLQQQIIKALGAKPQINAEEEIRRSVDFLKSYLQTYPFIKSLVLGISGGQDSTLAGKLCQMAINELRTEAKQRITAIYCRTPALWCSGRRTRLPWMPLPLFNRIAY